MTTTFQKKWSNAADVIACQVLARGNVVRKSGYLDLSSVDGAWLYGRIGRSDATALACTAGMPGVTFFAYPVGASSQINHPSSEHERMSGVAAATVGQIDNASGYEAGTVTMVVDGTSLVPAAGVELLLFFWGTATDPTTLSNGATLINAEWAKWSAGSATSLTVRQPTQNARVDNEYITTQADVFSRLWLPGGTKYDVGFDYGDDTAGSNVAVHAFCEILNYSEKVSV